MANEQHLSWEYVAGFVDGEGSITLQMQKNASGRHCRPILRIGNTNAHVLQLIRDFLGCGCINTMRRESKRWKPSWVLTIAGRKKLLPILISLRPYLVVKVAQADEVIAFMEEMTPTKGKWYTSLTQEELNNREQHVSRIRLLNRRGPEVMN